MKMKGQEEEKKDATQMLLCRFFIHSFFHKWIDCTYMVFGWIAENEKRPLALRPVKCAEHFQAINCVLMICFVWFRFRFSLFFPLSLSFSWSVLRALASHSITVYGAAGILICAVDVHACVNPHAHNVSSLPK